jgi:hypothetical protein
MSDPGRHAALFDGLPCEVRALAEIVQGLLIHQHIAPAYGVALNRDQQAQSHAIQQTSREISLWSRVEMLARRSPTLIIFEDAHWADPPSSALRQEQIELGRTPVCGTIDGSNINAGTLNPHQPKRDNSIGADARLAQ